MTNRIRFIVPALTLGLLVGAAAAQDKPEGTKPEGTKPAPAAQPVARPAASSGLARGSDLVGLDVMDAKNTKLGKVEDLLVSDSGEISAVIKREAGGLVCVPMSNLESRVKAPDKDAKGAETADVDAFVFTGDATKLATAPAVDSVDAIDAGAVARSCEHFGAKAAKRDGDKHDADKDKDGEPVTYGDKDKKPAATDAMSLKPWCLKKLMGTDIKDSAGEEVGEVKDVAVSLSQSDLAYVVISTGGVMGMGDKLHGISLKRLGHSSDGKSLTLPVTKDSLKSSGEGIDLDRLPSNPDLTGGSTGALENDSTDDNS